MPRRKSATKSRKSAGAVATEAQAETQPNLTVVDGGQTETTPASRRREHVDPSEFAALKAQYQMSNKDIAAAIGRTLARVSELTHSKGASIEVFERYAEALSTWREQYPIQSESK